YDIARGEGVDGHQSPPPRNALSRIALPKLVTTASNFLGLDPRHQPPQLAPDDLDRVLALSSARRLECRRVGLVLQNPFASKLPRLDFVENLLHLGLGLIGDDSRTARIVAVFGRIRDAVSHVVEAALIEQVDN